MSNIVIATIKSWNIANAELFREQYADVHKVTIISKASDLTVKQLDKLKPDYIFFPHWSWIIPESVYSRYTCIVFHMTDLPFGRGGSPLQNLLSRGIYKTKISALKVDGGLDTGPVYLKKAVSLEHGSAQTIFKKISRIVFSVMIPRIIKKQMEPKPQIGDITTFKRRKPEQSNLLVNGTRSLREIYDAIRMVDAEGYPPAFVSLPNGFLLTLKKARLVGTTQVRGTFEITQDSTD